MKTYKLASISDALRMPHRVANHIEREYLKDLLAKAKGDPEKAVKLYREYPLKDSSQAAVKKVTVSEMVPHYVNRVEVSSGFDEKRITKIPDPALQKQFREHLALIKKMNQARLKEEQIEPFSCEGIDILNKNRKIPIEKVRITEESESKFEIRPGAFTEADKGTNLFFVIYQNSADTADRIFLSIPLRTVIEAKASGSGFVEERPNYRWFTLSPGDLVYMPEEGENTDAIDWSNRTTLARKTYKLVSCNKAQAFFLPHTVSKIIADKVEFDSMNKVERALDGRMIKQHCLKLKVDRLGNIWPAK